MQVSDAPDAQTRSALSRMSDVLGAMTGQMSDVSQLVSDLTTRTQAQLTPEQMTQLQSIDRICQSLQDLEAISKALASGRDAQSALEVRLQLAETRAILMPEQDDSDTLPSGSLELF